MTKPHKRKWMLIRENLIFQVKLTLDAVRDVLLSPVAVTCTILDLIKGNQAGNGYFQRLMNLGHQSDHWLNLFGDLPKNSSEEPTIESSQAPQDINISAQKPLDSHVDGIFLKVEALLIEQQKSGELSVAAKQKLDQYLERLLSRGKKIKESGNVAPENILTPRVKTGDTPIAEEKE